MLPLSFGKQDEQSIQSFLDNYFKSEDLNESNGNLYSCQNCQSMQNAKKILKVVKQNDFLILTLNRFFYSSESNQHKKITTQLFYNPVLGLEINDGTRANYELIACVIHSGSSLHHGHYYAYINQDLLTENSWLLANDESLTLISSKTFNDNLNQFKNDTPYILFYKNLNTVENVGFADVDQNIPAFLKDLIAVDNRIYLKESNMQRSSYNTVDRSYFRNSAFKKDDSDDDDDTSRPSNQLDAPKFVF